MTMFQEEKNWINLNKNETLQLNTAKADCIMPRPSNNLKLQTAFP